MLAHFSDYTIQHVCPIANQAVMEYKLKLAHEDFEDNGIVEKLAPIHEKILDLTNPLTLTIEEIGRAHV